MDPLTLLYHDVIGSDPAASGFRSADADSYKLDEANFTAHLQRIASIKDVSVQLVTPSGDPERPAKGGARPVLLTFDDGGVSADQPTTQLLEARGWRGHFYIVTARIGEPGFLTREQIRSLHDRGHHVGSHSHTHPTRISHLGDAELLDEWSESRRILTEILGTPPFSVSVPGGFYSKRLARAVRRAGYTVLFNSEPTARTHRLDGVAIIGRYGIKRETAPEEAEAIARGDFAARARQALVWGAKKPLKKVGGTAWLKFRQWFFARRNRDASQPPAT